MGRAVYLSGKNRRMLDISEFQDLYDESKNKIWLTFDAWLKDGSGWIIQSIDEFHLKICKYTPLQGSSYIKLPNKIENSLSVVNVQNEDNKCFLYSVLAKLHPVKDNPQRVSNYEPYLKELKTDGITMPMRLQQIPKFEKQNDLSINVYMTDRTGEDKWPIYISKRRDNETINLLLLSDNEKCHYTLIKNFNAFCKKSKEHPKEFCPYCMHGFDKRYTNAEKMKNHMNDCFKYGGQKTNMPEQGKNIIKFNDIAKQQKLPFCIYADTECLLTKVENGKKKNSNKTHSHEISGYGYSVVSPFYPTVYKDFRGKDAGEKLLTNLMMEGSNLTKKIKEANKPMKFGELEKKVFMDATTCHICEKPLEDDINGRMDHLTNIQHWLEILNLDLRKVPSEKELKKAIKEYHGLKFTWNGIPVMNLTKKPKNKAEIKVGEKYKTVKLDVLKNLLMQMKL